MRVRDVLLWVAVAAGAIAGCSATNSGGGGSGGAGGTAGADASLGGGAGAGASGGSDAAINPAETVTVIGPGADDTAPGKFGGSEDPSSAPEIVYPQDGVVVPPNMNSLELHFKPGAGQTLFELRFVSAAIELVMYAGCTQVSGGCAVQTEDTFWKQLADKNRATAPVTYTIRGVNGASPGAVGTSKPQTIAFAKDDIVGGLYYWNSNGFIQRYEFGTPYKAAELYMTPQMAGALTCVGCHALSRDGTRMAIGKDIPAPAPYDVYDVAPRSKVGVPGQANFFAFSPDGKLLLYSDGVKIGLLESDTGKVVKDPLIPQGTMPDWSPDGKKIVYARPQTPPPLGFPNPGVASAGIEMVDYQTGGSVGAPVYLAQFQGQNNYYPAFSPTQDWVVFNRSPGNAESFSNAPPAGDGELWAVATAAGQAPIRMDAASTGGSTSWPKWAPDLSSYHGGPILWLTFTSARAYGLRLSQGAKAQLWMVGFDPTRAQAGKDPSLPGVWFPYQDISGGNHIAQWVTTVERQPCVDASGCLAGEICSNGKCYPVVK